MPSKKDFITPTGKTKREMESISTADILDASESLSLKRIRKLSLMSKGWESIRDLLLRKSYRWQVPKNKFSSMLRLGSKT